MDTGFKKLFSKKKSLRRLWYGGPDIDSSMQTQDAAHAERIPSVPSIEPFPPRKNWRLPRSQSKKPLGHYQTNSEPRPGYTNGGWSRPASRPGTAPDNGTFFRSHWSGLEYGRSADNVVEHDRLSLGGSSLFNRSQRFGSETGNRSSIPRSPMHLDILEAAFTSHQSPSSISFPTTPTSQYNEDVASRNVAAAKELDQRSTQYSYLSSVMYQEEVADRNIQAPPGDDTSSKILSPALGGGRPEYTKSIYSASGNDDGDLQRPTTPYSSSQICGAHPNSGRAGSPKPLAPSPNSPSVISTYGKPAISLTSYSHSPSPNDALLQHLRHQTATRKPLQEDRSTVHGADHQLPASISRKPLPKSRMLLGLTDPNDAHARERRVLGTEDENNHHSPENTKAGKRESFNLTDSGLQLPVSNFSRPAIRRKPLDLSKDPRGNVAQSLKVQGTRQEDPETTAMLNGVNHDIPASSPPKSPPLPRKILDLSQYSSADTTVETKQARAVTHETVHQDVHEIRKEEITRDIHTHDVLHRVLPIRHVETLPSRHFVTTADGDGLVEVEEKDVPGRVVSQGTSPDENLPKTPSEDYANPPERSMSKEPSKDPLGRRKRNPFSSAREFVFWDDNWDDDTKDMTDGVERTSETIIHPPELETAGRDTGQTAPMHFYDEIDTIDEDSRRNTYALDDQGLDDQESRPLGESQSRQSVLTIRAFGPNSPKRYSSIPSLYSSNTEKQRDGDSEDTVPPLSDLPGRTKDQGHAHFAMPSQKVPSRKSSMKPAAIARKDYIS